MRIDNKKDASAVTGKEREKKAKPKGSATGVGALFAGRLARAKEQGSDYTAELQRLKEEIDQAGEELEQEPTVANYRKFRDLLGALSKKVNAEAYRVEVLGGSSTGGRAHEVITVIDKEADLLYHLVMREQKDRIRIAAQIVKIRGLVVDILL